MSERATYASVQVFAFAPQAQLFTFQPTLDGVVYSVKVPWNVSGQRYYVTVTTQQGARVCTVPLIGSPGDFDINILDGFFTSLLVFRADAQRFEVLSDPVAVAA